MAKESLHRPDPFLLSKCHYTNLYSRFKNLSKTRASQILRTESLLKGTRYFKHIHDILSPPWYTDKKIEKNIPRSTITLKSRLRTNHTGTMGHLWEKNITASSECPCEHSFQDLNHVFFSCPNTQDNSNRFISGLKRINPNITLDTQTLAFTKDTRIYRLLSNFIKDSNLCI